MRRRLALLLAAAVAATSAALVPSPAQAVILAGPLDPGVETTVTVPVEDSVQFDVTVPAGARSAIRVSSISSGGAVTIGLRYTNPLPDSSQGGSDLVSDRNGVRYLEIPPYADPATPQPARVFVNSESQTPVTVTFTWTVAVDITRPVTSGEAVPLVLDQVPQRANLTFDAVEGTQVTVFVEDVDLPGATPPDAPGPVSLTLLPDRPTLFPGSPVFVRTSGPQTVVVDPAGLTGTLTVRVNLLPPPATRLPYDQPDATGVFVSSDGGPAVLGFDARTGADTLLHVVPNVRDASGGTGSATLRLVVPGAADVTLGSVSDAPRTFRIPELPRNVPVLVRVTADGSSSGSVEVRLRLDPGPATPVEAGVATTLTIPPGQASARYAIPASGDGILELFFGPATFGDPSVTSSAVTAESEFAEILGNGALSAADPTTVTVFAGGHGTALVTLTVDGAVGLTTTLLAAPVTTVPQDVTLPFDGDVDITTPGQNVELRVPASATGFGWTVSDVPGLAPVSSSGQVAALSVIAPDGSSVAFAQLAAGGTAFLEPQEPVQEGIYRLVVDPSGPATGALRATVEGPTVVTGLLPADTPTQITLPRAGAQARYTFHGAVGEKVIIRGTDVSLVGDVQSLSLSLLRPDGTLYAGTVVAPGDSAWLEPVDPLDAAGTWTLLVDAPGQTRGTVTVTRVAPRVTTSPIPVGTPTTVTVEGPGDVRRLTFQGTAGRRPVLRTSDVTLSGGRARLLDPTGAVIRDDFSVGASPYQEYDPLPTTGTYVLEVDPIEQGTGSFTLTLSLVADPVRRVASGERVNVAFTAGQNPTLRVDVRRGQRIGVDLARPTLDPPFLGLTVRFLRPDGSEAASLAAPPSSWVELPTPADVSGRWSVVLDPQDDATGRSGVTVWTSQDQVIANRVGRTTNVEVRTPGQNVVLPFQATLGGGTKYVRYEVSGSTFTDMVVWLYTPEGTPWTGQLLLPGDSSGTLPAPVFFDGRWSVVLDPAGDDTGRAKVRFSLVDTFEF